MTVPPPYLDGLLAAARPGSRGPATPPPAVPSLTAESAESPVVPGESVSHEERIKRSLHPLESYARLWECAAANRPPDADDQFRFQWFGLFYQAPVQDAFTLRLRLPGGRLKPFQLAGLAHLTQAHASGEAVLNAQGGLDLPGVPVTSAIEILRGVEGLGLSARQTGGDCVQSIRGGEYDGLFADGRHAPVYPLVRALEQALAYSPACSDLPRGCEIHFQMADEASVVRQDSSVVRIVLQPSPRPPTRRDDAESSQPTPFVLLTPGVPEGGFLLPHSQIVTGCIELLKRWAAAAERTTRDCTGLAAFIGRLGIDGTSALLGGAKHVSIPPRSVLEVNGPGQYPLPGFPIRGARLLSGQLAALEQCCREEGLREIRLARGRLVAVGATGEEHATSVALDKALSI